MKDLSAEHWAINYAELIVDKVVGKFVLIESNIHRETYVEINRGASGTVHLGNWRGIKVAIKIFNTTSLDAAELDEFIGMTREITTVTLNFCFNPDM